MDGDDLVLTAHTGCRGDAQVKEHKVKYLILMQVDPAVLEGLTPEQQSQVMAGHQKFMSATKESGEFLSTYALADPAQTVTVRASNGAPEVSDGPFAEAKEYMGGFYLVDVENHERAVELARQIPDAAIDGLALEVRPVMFFDGADM